MPYIRECIVTTVDGNGKVHIAPLGIIAEKDGWVIAPFRPSVTLDNLAAAPFAVASYTDDVRIFAGCLTGRKDWPTVAVDGCPVPRLEAALAHSVLQVVSVHDDQLRNPTGPRALPMFRQLDTIFRCPCIAPAGCAQASTPTGSRSGTRRG